MLCLVYLFLPFAQAANSIQWINPAAGTALTPGQSVEAKWTSTQPIKDPTFSLCTADARCGQSTPAKIIDNPDGTTSALLSIPKMDGGSGMFLQMSDKAGGAIHNSPTFKLSAAPPQKALAEHSGEINERVPAPRKDEAPDPEADADSGAESDSGAAASETSYNPYKWDDEGTGAAASAGPTPTDADAAQSLLSAAAGSVTSGLAFPTSFDPSMLPAAYRSQWPFSNPYAAMNMTSSASTGATAAAAEDSSGDHARPNAAIIAVPLSICGAILLASLLFCARSRMRKQKDLETGRAGPGAPPPDWQAAIKRKALKTSVEKGPEGMNSVTVTERRDDAIVPTLGYAQPPPRPRGPPPREETFYDDPYTRYDPYGRGGRHVMDDRRDSYGYKAGRSIMESRSGSRCLTPMRERKYDHYSARRMEDHARSESRYYHERGSRPRSGYESRGSKDRWEDEYDYRHPPVSRDDYYTPTRRTRSGLGGMDERDCDCSSCRASHRGYTECHREGSVSSRPRTPHSDPMRDLPGPTYSRPLPEPMIRNHMSSMSGRTARYREEEYMPKGKHCEPPHRSGVLRRADSGTSNATDAGWDLAGKGAYETSHGRGMGELYESLRRAIGESEPPRSR